MAKLVFLDTETTGLNPELHDVWEIAVITNDGEEHRWTVRPDLTHADPNALKIGGYYERARLNSLGPDAENVAGQLARLLDSATVVGSNPSFDQAFLTRWLRKYGQCWTAHYRTVDIVTLGHGYLVGCEPGYSPAEHMPPATHDVCRAFGIDPGGYDRHTALGDARMVRDLYTAITKES